MLRQEQGFSILNEYPLISADIFNKVAQKRALVVTGIGLRARDLVPESNQLCLVGDEGTYLRILPISWTSTSTRLPPNKDNIFFSFLHFIVFISQDAPPEDFN